MSVIRQSGSAARVLELHYMSQDDAILDVVRSVAALDTDQRLSVQRYAQMLASRPTLM